MRQQAAALQGFCANAMLDELETRKKVADFEGRGFRRVRAVRAVGADAGAEVVADRARSGFFGIGGTHGIAPFQDGALGFEDQRYDFARAHEVREFTKERTGAVDGVKTASFFFGQAHRFYRDDFEPSFVDAGKNLALLACGHGVRLDDCKSTFECHSVIPPNIFELFHSKKTQAEACATKNLLYFRAAATVLPKSAGVSTQRIPAADMAAYLSLAVP